MGSSPLSWGKPRIQSTISFDIRIIPTHAGRTEDTVGRLVTARAHPRSCGENCSTAASVSRSSGSSPLTRGKLAVPDAALRRGGLIPAHTGKHGGQAGLEVAAGLIPAHAGKTMVGLAAARACWAHPHSHGENFWILPDAPGIAGSSLLTLGKRATSRQPFDASRAHPRSRGENVTVLPQQSAQPGSSPLTQGKHLVASARHAIEGLIPAHAGKTAHPKIGLSSSTAHPRSRGENAGHDTPAAHGGGSSPLTRGKPA